MKFTPKPLALYVTCLITSGVLGLKTTRKKLDALGGDKAIQNWKNPSLSGWGRGNTSNKSDEERRTKEGLESSPYFTLQSQRPRTDLGKADI